MGYATTVATLAGPHPGPGRGGPSSDFGIASRAPSDEGLPTRETLTLHRAMTPATPARSRCGASGSRPRPTSTAGVALRAVGRDPPYRLDGRTFETIPTPSAARTLGPLGRLRPHGRDHHLHDGPRAGRGIRRRGRRGDLDAVLLKALRKEPQSRYGSVAAPPPTCGFPCRPAGPGAARLRRYRRRTSAGIGPPKSRRRVAGLILACSLLPSVRARLWGRPRAAELAVFYSARPADSETVRLLRAGADRLALYDAVGARALFHRAAARTPDSATAWDGVARAERDLGEVGKADAAARRASAVRDVPHNDLPLEEAERLRARALGAELKWLKALPAEKALLERLPRRLDVGLDLVAALLRRGGPKGLGHSRGCARRPRRPASGIRPRLDLAEAEVAHRLGSTNGRGPRRYRARAGRVLLPPLALRAEQLWRCHSRLTSAHRGALAAHRLRPGLMPRGVRRAAPARLALGILLLRTAGNDEARAVLERAGAGYRATGDRRGGRGAQPARHAGRQARRVGGKDPPCGGAGDGPVDRRPLRRRGRAGKIIILLNWADEEAEVDALAPTWRPARVGQPPGAHLGARQLHHQRGRAGHLARAEGYIEEAERRPEDWGA